VVKLDVKPVKSDAIRRNKIIAPPARRRHREQWK